MPDTAPPAGDLTPIDWARAREFLLACVRHRLDRESPENQEDLAHIALVRLVRIARRERIGNVQALMNTLAQQVVVDFLRHRRRWRLLVEPFAERAAGIAGEDAPTGVGDPLERVRFVVLEFFTSEHAPCAELARAYFAEVTWKDLAARFGVGHNTLIKRWSMCMKRLRAAARREANPLLEWCHE